jgi:competence protein ComEA
MLLRQPPATNDAAILINGASHVNRASQAPVQLSATSDVPPPTRDRIAVDVIGAVQQPGVYYVPKTARIADAVEAAGGLAPNADRERINLAATVKDGEQIRVPQVGAVAEADAPAGAVAVQPAGTAGLININTADAHKLEELPGIGPATAQAIIAYREANGPFKHIDELENVPRVGASTIDKFRDQVTVGP